MTLIDDCQTAAQVRERAARVLTFRRSITAPAPKPVVPKAPVMPLPAQMDEPIWAIANAVAAKFCITREILVVGGMDDAPSAALLATCALVVRRLGIPRRDVVKFFGVSDPSVQRALHWIDQIYIANTFSKFSSLDAVLAAIHTDWLEIKPARRVAIRDIQLATCDRFNVDLDDILSARRTANVVRPRQIAVWICKRLTLKSLPEIGRAFGGRDHTTALSSIRKIERLRATDEALRSEIDGIIASLMVVR